MRHMYSEEQLGRVAQKELKDKDLVVKTIQQEVPNAEFSISAPTISGFTKLNEYSTIKLYNKTYKILHFKKAVLSTRERDQCNLHTLLQRMKFSFKTRYFYS